MTNIVTYKGKHALIKHDSKILIDQNVRLLNVIKDKLYETMGVKLCDRNGCTNVMCDTYVPDFGYICYSCKDEYIMRNTGKHERRKSAEKSLRKFMDEPKGVVLADAAFDVNKLFW